MRISVLAVLSATLLCSAAPSFGAAQCSPTPANSCICNGDFEQGSLNCWNGTFVNSCNSGCTDSPCITIISPASDAGCNTPGSCCCTWSPGCCQGSINVVACGSFACQIFSGEDFGCGTWGQVDQTFVLPAGGARLSMWYAHTQESCGNGWGEFAFDVSGSCGSFAAWQVTTNNCTPWTAGAVNLCGYSNCTVTARARAVPVGSACVWSYVDDVFCEPCVTTFTPSPTATVTSTVTSTSTITATATVTATDTLTATVTSTITISPTPTVTATVTASATVTGTFTVTLTMTDTSTITVTETHSPTSTPTLVAVVSIFNTAGEKIRTFRQAMPAEVYLPSDIQLAPNPFSPDGDGYQDQLQVLFPGGYALTWDGKNDQLRTVENGPYWIRVSFVNDSGSALANFDRKAIVLKKGNTIHVTVTNLAGDLKYDFPPIIGPVRFDDFQLVPNPYSPGLNSLNAWNTLQIKLHGTNDAKAPTPAPGVNDNLGIVIPYLGVDTQGHLLSAGTYYVNAISLDPEGKKVTISKSLVCLKGKQSLLRELRPYPNPYPPKDETNMYFAYTIPNADHVKVTVKIYDLQGRFVDLIESNVVGEPDITGVPFRYRIPWNALTKEKLYLADGLYFAEYSARDDVSGVTESKTVKFVIQRRKDS